MGGTSHNGGQVASPLFETLRPACARKILGKVRKNRRQRTEAGGGDRSVRRGTGVRHVKPLRLPGGATQGTDQRTTNAVQALPLSLFLPFLFSPQGNRGQQRKVITPDLFGMSVRPGAPWARPSRTATATWRSAGRPPEFASLCSDFRIAGGAWARNRTTNARKNDQTTD